MISVDCETTGVDLHHGAKPFLVTTCTQGGEVRYWEWDVDPFTRDPIIPESDVEEIGDLLFSDGPNGPQPYVFQNPKFDISALNTIGLWNHWDVDEVWKDIHDTLIAGHLLASNQPHDLTSMAIHYLGINPQKYENDLERAVKSARSIVRRKDFIESNGEWRIAKAGLPEAPSCRAESWRFDYWLPKALVKHFWEASEAVQTHTHKAKSVAGLPGWEYRPPRTGGENDPGHPWWTVLSNYANSDSETTVVLWQKMRAEIERRGLWSIYLERMKVLPIAYRMEQDGVTLSKNRLNDLIDQYQEESSNNETVCKEIASGFKVNGEPFDLTLPKNGVNNSLRDLCFNVMKLPAVRNKKAKTAEPTLNKEAIEYYLTTLNEGPALDFIKALRAKRKRDTSIAYMLGYQRYWRKAIDDTYILHPNLNPTGTDTLRWSSSNPNEQNISKQGMFEGDTHTLRYCFGPREDEEWWSCDAKNIELRIPAYEAGEQAMIDLFERPDDPPYYGSNHLLNFHTVYPDIWAKELIEVGFNKVGPHCKKKYANSWYQCCKNGGFCKQYGGQEALTDATFRRIGAHRLLDSRFTKLTALNQKCLSQANRLGYVETMPDRSVDPAKGYPLLCTRTEYGKALPTVPLSYHVQGTAMWWTMKAMIRCQAQLDEWRRKDRFNARMVMQVHDEIVFCFPKSKTCPIEESKKNSKFRLGSNLWRIRVLADLMAKGGDDLGLPTPVGIEYHVNNWSEGVTI